LLGRIDRGKAHAVLLLPHPVTQCARGRSRSTPVVSGRRGQPPIGLGGDRVSLRPAVELLGERKNRPAPGSGPTLPGTPAAFG
jgi:hypothetical protein